MSLTMQQLLADAKSLTTRLSEDDAKLNGLVSDAQTVFSTIESLREYNEDVEELNEAAHQRPRTTLVSGIQQENRHIRELQHENRELKAALEEHQNALDLIMSKYRQQVLKLIQVNKAAKPPQVRANDFSKMAEKCQEKVQEMVVVMKQAVSVDDQAYPKQQELIARLMTENKTLRELLQISEKHGTLPPGSRKKALWKEKQTQTDSVDSVAPEESHVPEACPACGHGFPEAARHGEASPSESPYPGLDVSVASSDTGSVDSVMMSPTRAAAAKVDASTGPDPSPAVSTPDEAPSSIPADILT